MDKEPIKDSAGSADRESGSKVTEINKDSGVKKPGFFRRNPVLTTALIGILAVAIVYFWKDMERKRKVASIQKMATEQMVQNSEDMLKLATKPFVWSVRAEMLRENMDQVNNYFKEMVREKNFELIYLVNPDQKIIVSTDKKLEGQSANELFDPTVFQTDSIIVLKKDDKLTIAAPVMGYDKKLGVLIMKYSIQNIKMDIEKKAATEVNK